MEAGGAVVGRFLNEERAVHNNAMYAVHASSRPAHTDLNDNSVTDYTI